MNSVLPVLPKAAPSAPADAAPQRDAVEESETFASVMDRRNPPGRNRADSGEPRRADAEVKNADVSDCAKAREVSDDPRPEESEDADETVIPPPQLAVALPTLPYHIAEDPASLWQAVLGEMSPTDGGEEAAADSVEADSLSAQKPAQSATVIFAGPSQGLPILAAMFPVSMAQLQAQLQVRPEATAQSSPSPTAAGHLPVASIPALGQTEARPVPVFPAVTPHVGAEFPAALQQPQPMPAEAGAETLEQAVRSLVPEQLSFFTPQQLPRSFAAPVLRGGENPLTVAEGEASPELVDATSEIDFAGFPIDASAVSRPARRMAPESSLVDGVLPTHGTPTAKGGEVMHDIPFQAPPKPRVARPSESRIAVTESSQVTLQNAVAPATELPAIAVAPTEAQGRRTIDERPANAPLAEARETFPPTAQPGTATGAEVEPAHSARQSATAAEPAERAIAEHQPGAEVRLETSNGMPTDFPTVRPQVERTSSEPVSPDAPITRAEMVQVVERTADAAVRMRAAGNERIEVAVQLESGDHLTIQLRIANGEVTSHFRTSSEGLRTALEQNWTQFSDRANDRGVRMTQPVFDVSQSSSNMTDLSQQRHGRDPGYTDPQAELFPNLPRRMRAPRVISAAPLEPASAASAGVRTYA